MKKLFFIIFIFILSGCSVNKTIESEPILEHTLEPVKSYSISNVRKSYEKKIIDSAFKLNIDVGKSWMNIYEYELIDGEWRFSTGSGTIIETNQGELNLSKDIDKNKLRYSFDSNEFVTSATVNNNCDSLSEDVINFEVQKKLENVNSKQCLLVYSIGNQENEIKVEDYKNPENIKLDSDNRYFAITIEFLDVAKSEETYEKG